MDKIARDLVTVSLKSRSSLCINPEVERYVRSVAMSELPKFSVSQGEASEYANNLIKRFKVNADP